MPDETADLSPSGTGAPIPARLDQLRAGKVEVHVKAIGAAPTLRQPRFTMAGSKKFGELIQFLKSTLKTESLHVYCADAFEPSVDEAIADLKECFGIGGKLSVSYSTELAFS
mmetsp:Transcript_82/g.70  ORF Transcript_82/g.70 Transcript_82/m.70 type:complete len:112 (-) Transcript_82:27-362(-)